MPRGIKAKPSVSIDGNDIVNTSNDDKAINKSDTDTNNVDETATTKSDTNAMPVSQEKPASVKAVKDYVFTTRTMIGDRIFEENEKCSVKGDELEMLINKNLVKLYQAKKYIYTQNYWKDNEKYTVGDEFKGNILERNKLKKQGIIEES